MLVGEYANLDGAASTPRRTGRAPTARLRRRAYTVSTALSASPRGLRLLGDGRSGRALSGLRGGRLCSPGPRFRLRLGVVGDERILMGRGGLYEAALKREEGAGGRCAVPRRQGRVRTR
ncbi:MAG: hypothetical protein ABWK05_02030 [Pyrobaculum sp.]